MRSCSTSGETERGEAEGDGDGRVGVGEAEARAAAACGEQEERGGQAAGTEEHGGRKRELQVGEWVYGGAVMVMCEWGVCWSMKLIYMIQKKEE